MEWIGIDWSGAEQGGWGGAKRGRAGWSQVEWSGVEQSVAKWRGVECSEVDA